MVAVIWAVMLVAMGFAFWSGLRWANRLALRGMQRGMATEPQENRLAVLKMAPNGSETIALLHRCEVVERLVERSQADKPSHDEYLAEQKYVTELLQELLAANPQAGEIFEKTRAQYQKAIDSASRRPILTLLYSMRLRGSNEVLRGRPLNVAKRETNIGTIQLKKGISELMRLRHIPGEFEKLLDTHGLLCNKASD